MRRYATAEIAKFVCFLLLVQQVRPPAKAAGAPVAPSIPARSATASPAHEAPSGLLAIQAANDYRPVIAAGRRLSPASAPEVTNGQVTITYSAYNLRDQQVDGVLLTVALAPGVNVVSTSPRADTSGAELAWQLGSLPANGSANVLVKVSFAGAPPARFDDGAKVHAYWAGRGFSNVATPAALRTTAPPAGTIAATPDANPADTSVAAKASELGFDPGAMFRYVRDSIGNEVYAGSLRGARGALWGKAGNSIDKSSLLIAMLRAAGIPARYARGTLAADRARQIIASMFPTRTSIAGFVAQGEAVSNPLADTTLLAEASDHFWVQYDDGSGYRDLDTAFAVAQPGNTFASATATFNEVPDNLRHKVTIRLNAETYTNFLFAGTSTAKVLEHTVNAAEVAGQPLTLGHQVDTRQIGAIVFSSVTHTYSPYLLIGQNDLDLGDDPLIRGTDYQETLTNFPGGSQILTGVFLEFAVRGPDGQTRTFQRTLFDRIGFAARQGLSTAQVTASPSATPSLSPFDNVTIRLDSSLVPLEAGAVVAQREVLLQQRQSAAAQGVNLNSTAPTDVARQTLLSQAMKARLIGLTQSVAASYLPAADQLLPTVAGSELVKAYFASPRILLATAAVKPGSPTSTLEIGVDRNKDDVRGFAAPGQAAKSASQFQFQWGVAQGALEHQFFQGLGVQGQGITLRTSISAIGAFEAAKAQNIDLIAYDAGSAHRVAGSNYSDDAKARISLALAQGKLVLAPSRAPTIGGQPRMAWFETDPATGVTLDTAEDGTHSNLVSLAGQYTAVSTLIGGLGFGTAVITLQCLKAGNLGCAAMAAGVGVLLVAVAAVYAAWVAVMVATIRNGGTLVGGAITVAQNIGRGGAAAAAASGGAAGAATDPPTGGSLVGQDLNVPFTRPAFDTRDAARTANASAGALAGTVQSPATRLAGSLGATWTSAASTTFTVTAINAANATVRNAANQTVGTGAVAFSAGVPATASASGNTNYALTGQGDLELYASAGSGLGAAGNWTSFTATLTNAPVVQITTGALTVGGNALPEGTYTISAASIAMSGRGPSAAPDFAGNAAINASNAALSITPATGALTLGGAAVDLAPGVSFTGYTGTVGVAEGALADTLTIAGTAANVLQTSGAPNSITATQNTPASFDLATRTSLAGQYRLTAEAPTGWTVAMTDAGRVTVTPAPGTQSGVFTVFVRAASLADPNLAAHGEVTVNVGATQPGVTINLTRETMFTLPLGGAELPSGYRAAIRNLGPTANTFQLAFTGLPSGFTVATGPTTFDLPPGGMANLGFFLDPGSSLPAAGTQVPFTARVTSTTSPSLTAQASDTFTVPAVAALAMDTAPANLTTTGTTPVTSTLRLRSVGNSPVTATITPFVPTGLALAGLTASVNIAAGQTQTQTLTFTPQSSAPLGRPIISRFDAAFGNGLTATAGVNVTINAAQAQSAFTGAAAATGIGRSDIAVTLANLSAAITELSANPNSGAHRTAVLTYIDFLSAQMNAPYLANFPAELAAVRAAVASSAAGALDQLDAVIGRLTATLSSPVAFDFDFLLIPNTAAAVPNTPTAFSVFLRNKGTTRNTYALSLGALPAGVNGALNLASVTLDPGASTGAPGPNPSVTITPSTGTAFEFTVTATVNGVAGSARTIRGHLVARSELISVVDVISNPAFTNAGGSVNVTARLANQVNQSRQVTARLEVKNAANTVVRTVDRDVTLSVASLITTVDFGGIDTSGLANGNYSLNVTVPGAAGSGTLLIGQPVSSTLTVSPTVVGAGASRVTTTLTTKSTGTNTGGGTFTLLGSANTDGGGIDLATRGNIAYVCGTKSIGVVDVSNPAAPRTIRSVGQTDLDGKGYRCATYRDGARLAAVTFDGGASGIVLYDLTNPEQPVRVAASPLPELFTGTIVTRGDVALLTTSWFRYFVATGSIFEQNGYVYSLNLLPDDQIGFAGAANHLEPAQDPIGVRPKQGALFMDATTALIGGTTSEAGNTNGEGRLHAADISNFGPSVFTTIRVPGTTWVLPFPASGNVILVPGLTRGWNTPGGAGPNYDFDPRGNLALVTVDISNPRSPKVIKVADTGIRSTYVYAAQAGPNRYALHVGYGAGDPAGAGRLMLADISDPNNPVLTQGPVTYQYAGQSVVSSLQLGRIAFANDTLYVSTPTGVSTYRIGSGGAPQYTARLTVPKGGKVAYDPASFSVAPTIATGSASDTLTWTNPSTDTITFASNISGAQSGEQPPVVNSAVVDFSTSLGNGTINLPGASVGVEHVIGMSPASRTVAPGEQASYTVTLRNPSAAAVTYTLSASGVASSWVTLPSQATVAAGGTTTVDLRLRSALADAAGTYGFVVSASGSGLAGSVQGSLVLQGTGTVGAAASFTGAALDVALTPASQTGGIAAPVIYTMRVTNTGNTADTFVASAQLPAGLSATFTPAQVEVQPGLSNFRDIRMQVTAAQGTAAGAKAITARATSVSNASITGSAAGTLNLVSQGVAVTLTPDPVAPGGTAQLAVTNRGSAQDTFDLALGGAGALFATLGSATATVPAGGTVNVAVTIAANVPFSLGATALLATATSRGNNAVRARAETRIAVPASKGLSAGFQPARQAPGTGGFTAFLLELRNNGTLEDDYRVRITGKTGNVQAVLRDGAGIADQFVSPVTVPATSTGTLVLEATAGDDKGATITVEVQSLTDASIKTTATAVIGDTGGPAADAGKDRNVRTGKHTLLDGSGSSDPGGRALTYRWTLTARPQGSTAVIVGDRLPRPTLRPDVDGAYTLRLVVTAGGTDSQPDDVVITAFSGAVPPNADAGPRQSVRRGGQASVDGSRSFDPDRAPQALTHRWTVLSVPPGSAVTNASLTNATQALARFTADTAGDYQLQLEVSDGAATSRDTTVVTAVDGNVPPNAVAGLSRRALTGAAVALDGSASNDPDSGPQALAFQWSQVFGGATLTNANAARATLTGAATGQSVAQVEVRDGAASATSRVAVLFSTRCDANADTVVDAIDFDLLEESFGAASPGGDPLDANNDGVINDADIQACRGGGPLPGVPIVLRIRADPDRLEFLAQRGQPAPAAKFVDIEGDRLTLTARILFGSWMTVSLNRPDAPARMAVNVSAEGLPAGIHEGSIVITAPGANSVEVRVRLTVIDAPRWEFVPDSLRFSWKTGDPDPPVRKLSVYSSGRSVRYVARTDQPWVTALPATGETPAILDVAVSPRGLAPGSHRARIILSSPDPVAGEGSVDVFLDIAQPPPVISLDGVRNGASKAVGPVAPFETVEIRGSDLAVAGQPVSARLDGVALPFRLGETEVLADGVPVGLLSAEISTVRAVMPEWIEGKREVDIAVRRGGVTSAAVRVPVALSAPGVFTNDATGVGTAAANHDGARNSLTNPVRPGTVVSFLITGEGSWEPASEAHVIPTAADRQPRLPLTVEAAGQAAEVFSVTSVPGLPGLMQVNARLASAAAMPSEAREIALFVTVDGQRSQPGVTLFYRP